MRLACCVLASSIAISIATSIPDSCILRDKSVSLSKAVVALSSIPAGLSTAHFCASSPWVVLHPIVNLRRQFGAIHKSNIAQCANECAVFTGPIHAQFNVLIREAGQVAVAAVLCCPQEQANQIPSGASSQPLD